MKSVLVVTLVSFLLLTASLWAYEPNVIMLDEGENERFYKYRF